jgi:hypothetical protein
MPDIRNLSQITQEWVTLIAQRLNMIGVAASPVHVIVLEDRKNSYGGDGVVFDPPAAVGKCRAEDSLA